MKRSILFLFGLLFSVFAMGQDAKQIVGTYLSHDEDIKTEIYIKGDGVEGLQVWTEKDGNTRDKNHIVLRNLTYNEKKQRWVGRIFDPRFKTEYKVEVTLLEDGNIKITPSLGFIKMNFVWTRLSDCTQT